MIPHDKRAEVVERFRSVINTLSLENGSNTPDFLLAEYLVGCLEVWNVTCLYREKWYGREPKQVLNPEHP